MNGILRLDNIGPVADTARKPALENATVKGYGNMAAIVPEGYYFLLAVEMQELYLHFGDAFGDITFLAAIYHPEHADGLPTGLLLMDTPDFLKWLYTDGDLTSVSKPEPQHFCFSDTKEFVESNKTIDQVRSKEITDTPRLKNAFTRFIKYFKELKGESSDHYRECLGIPIDSQAQGEIHGKVELSEAEKQAIENGQGPKKSSRIASKSNVFYGLSVVNKVPIGAINLPTTVAYGKQQGATQPTNNGSNKKKQKVADSSQAKVVDSQEDLRNRGQKAADTKKANKAAEEARMNAAINNQMTAVNNQLLQLQKQVAQSALPPNNFQQATKGQLQQHTNSLSTSEQHRMDMGLDFKMMETAVMSFENFADRRFDKFVSTTK
jgi:hypothetical protein